MEDDPAVESLVVLQDLANYRQPLKDVTILSF